MSFPWFYLIVGGVIIILVVAGLSERQQPRHKGEEMSAALVGVAIVFGFLLVSFGAALLIGRFIAVGHGPERGE